MILNKHFFSAMGMLAVMACMLIPGRLFALEALTEKELTRVRAQSGPMLTLIVKGADPRADLLATSDGGSAGVLDLTSPSSASHYVEFFDDNDGSGSEYAAVSIAGDGAGTGQDFENATIDSLRLTLDTYTWDGTSESGVILQAYDWSGELYIKADAVHANDASHTNDLFGLSIGEIDLVDFDDNGGPLAALSIAPHSSDNDWGVSGAGVDIMLSMQIHVHEFALYPSTGVTQCAKDIVLAKEFDGTYNWNAETADTDPLGTWQPTGAFGSDRLRDTAPLSIDAVTDNSGNQYLVLYTGGQHQATYTYPVSGIATYGVYAQLPQKDVSHHIGAGRVARFGYEEGLVDGEDHVGGMSVAGNVIYTKVVIPQGNRTWNDLINNSAPVIPDHNFNFTQDPSALPTSANIDSSTIAWDPSNIVWNNVN